MNSTLSNNFVVERGDDGGEYVADEMNKYCYVKDDHRQYKSDNLKLLTSDTSEYLCFIYQITKIPKRWAAL